MFNLSSFYDEKRCGYFVSGDGFDFFAYHVGDSETPEAFGIECDHVERSGYGNGYSIHLYIPLLQAPMSETVLVNAINRELAKHELFLGLTPKIDF